MRNKLWKRNRLKVLKFVLAVCMWTDGIRGSRGLKSDASPPGDVSSREMISKLGEISEVSIESSSSRPWVPKCCNLSYGFTFRDKSLCVETGEQFLPDFEDWPDYSRTAKKLPAKARYEYFIGDPCLDGKYLLDSVTYPDDNYSIYTNGTLFYSNLMHDKEEFCLETLNGTIRAFVCFGAGKAVHEMNYTFILYAIGLIVSIPFLLATALTYLCVERFRDLRGKSLSCHVLCLATGYLVLAFVQLSSDQLDEAPCIIAGFIIQFFFVASFFWLNIVCYDTWRCMNSNDFQRVLQQKYPPSEKIEFFKYSLYGWYGPAILTIVTLIMDLEPAIPESFIKPNFGLKSCWFHSDDAVLPYFYGPIAIIISINILLFFLCARKIYLHHKTKEECKATSRNSVQEIREMNHSIRLYCKILWECIYLFCIMGINWIAEVLSWALGGSETIWFVTDVFNALQGVIIFFLLVIKPKSVRNEVKRRICLVWKKVTKGNRRHKGNCRSRDAEPHYESAAFDETRKFLYQSASAPTGVTTTV